MKELFVVAGLSVVQTLFFWIIMSVIFKIFFNGIFSFTYTILLFVVFFISNYGFYNKQVRL